MSPESLSGLVLTHADRDPRPAIRQLSQVCGQIVLVRDTSTEAVFEPDMPINPDCELTVLERSFDTFPAQRNAGIEKALGEWVLSVDSDESLSQELLEEIAELEPDADDNAYRISRTEFVGGREIRQAYLQSREHARLFRSSLRYKTSQLVHEEFEDLDYASLSSLSGSLIHNTNESGLELIKKAFNYGKLGAGSMRESGWVKTALTAPYKFVRERFWRDGWRGACLALCESSYKLGIKLGATDDAPVSLPPTPEVTYAYKNDCDLELDVAVEF